MATRLCGACQQEKSIRGVWYLTPADAPESPFLCESCYRGPGAVTFPGAPTGPASSIGAGISRPLS